MAPPGASSRFIEGPMMPQEWEELMAQPSPRRSTVTDLGSPNLRAALQRFNDRQSLQDAQQRVRHQVRTNLMASHPSSFRPVNGHGVPGIMGSAAEALGTMSRVAAPIDDGWETVADDEGAWEAVEETSEQPTSSYAGLAPAGLAEAIAGSGPRLENLAQGFSDPFGLGGEIYGASEMLRRASPSALLTGDYSSDFETTYEQARDRREQELADARARSSGEYGLGQFAQSLPLLASPPVSLGAMVATGAGMGGLQGAGMARPGERLGGAAKGAAVGAATSLVGGAVGKGVQALGQRGGAMAQRGKDALLKKALDEGQNLTPQGVQQLFSSARREGAQKAAGAAMVGSVAGGFLGTPKLAPAAAIANIERLAKSNPEVALAWGSLLGRLRGLNPGRLAAWMNVLGRATTPEEFMSTYEQLQASDGTPQEMQ